MALKALPPESIPATELAGNTSEAKLAKAPGNGQPAAKANRFTVRVNGTNEELMIARPVCQIPDIDSSTEGIT